MQARNPSHASRAKCDQCELFRIDPARCCSWMATRSPSHEMWGMLKRTREKHLLLAILALVTGPSQAGFLSYRYCAWIMAQTGPSQTMNTIPLSVHPLLPGTTHRGHAASRLMETGTAKYRAGWARIRPQPLSVAFTCFLEVTYMGLLNPSSYSLYRMPS